MHPELIRVVHATITFYSYINEYARGSRFDVLV